MDSQEKASFAPHVCLQWLYFLLPMRSAGASTVGSHTREAKTFQAWKDSSLLPLMSLPRFHLQLNQKLSDSFTPSQSSPLSECPTTVGQRSDHENLLPGTAVSVLPGIRAPIHAAANTPEAPR